MYGAGLLSNSTALTIKQQIGFNLIIKVRIAQSGEKRVN
jgi:hypothetical protein